MKKIILLGTAVVLITAAFAFTSSPVKFFEKKPYCVKMQDTAKNNKAVYITLETSGPVEAQKTAISMYPHLKYVTTATGACR